MRAHSHVARVPQFTCTALCTWRLQRAPAAPGPAPGKPSVDDGGSPRTCRNMGVVAEPYGRNRPTVIGWQIGREEPVSGALITKISTRSERHHTSAFEHTHPRAVYLFPTLRPLDN